MAPGAAATAAEFAAAAGAALEPAGPGAACADVTGEPASSTGAVRPAESPSHLNRKIAELKAEQAKMQEDRKRLKKELRNTARKRKRIKERARQLTEDDLVAVLMMRKEHRRDPAAKEAASTASTTPTGAGPADAEGVASPIESVGGPTQLEEMPL